MLFAWGERILGRTEDALLLEHFDPQDLPNIALACLHSLMTSAVLVASGVYLGRTGIMNREVTRGVSELTLRVTMPCLLFTRVVAAMDMERLALAFPMLLLPMFHVAVGLCLGRLVLMLCSVPKHQRSTVLCAVAFGNPLSMPLMLLAVVKDEMFNPDVLAQRGMQADPIFYLSLYQPLSYILMYALGGHLLGVRFDAPEATPAKGMYIIPESPRKTRRASSAAVRDASERDTLDFDPSPVLSDVLTPRNSKDADERAGMVRNESREVLLGHGAPRSDERAAVTPAAAVGAPPPVVVAAAAAAATAPLPLSWWRLLAQAMSPPVTAVMLGMVCGLLPPAKALFWPEGSALLGPCFKGMERLAGAALPVSMLLLGVSISKGPDWSAVDTRTNACVCAAKMVGMPLVAVAVWSALAHSAVGASWRFLDQEAPFHAPIFLTALTVSAMPTGNTMLMLVELGGGDRQGLSTLIFLQYLVAPVLLTMSLALFVIVVTSGVV